MSRFEEVVNEAIDEVVLGETLRAEELAAHIAERVRERQEGLRAEVPIAARYPETVPTPASSLDPGDLHPVRHGGRLRARHPHPHRRRGAGDDRLPLRPGLLADRARERLAADGFTADEIERIFEAVPVATHNQRGIGPFTSAAPRASEVDIDARDLLHIVEQSMSSEIYELMKRSDEVAVVEKAHRSPASSRTSSARWSAASPRPTPGLRDGGFVLARQENLETIHRHSVVAERSGPRRDPRRARDRASTPATT